MNIEYEVKILDIDANELETTLTAHGFSKQPTILFKRYIYALKDDDRSWLRLRTNGTKTTLTLKRYVRNSIDGIEETEITVSDFETTHALLEGMGFTAASYQENRRTLFVSTSDPAIEVSIDEWPHIAPYLEIEGKTETMVKSTLKKLDLSHAAATSAPTSEVYKRYGKDINSYPRLTFAS